MKHILITGINGFVGQHLARELHEHNIVVYGCGLNDIVNESLSDIVRTFVANCDLTNVKDVSRLPLNRINAVINLAGLAQVGSSFGRSDEYNEINVKVHTTLAQAIEKSDRPVRMISVSTGAVYDNHQPMPLIESSKLITQGSPYALSKIAMEQALKTYTDRGVDIVIVRPFNHIGPGQLPGFLVPDLAHEIQNNSQLRVGNLKTQRDYTDVRDVVRAYRLLATQPKLHHKIYNVCRGKSIMGETILAMMLDEFHKPGLEIIVDRSKIRPDDPENVTGDNARLIEETNWQPEIPIEQTIKDFVVALKN